MFERFECQIEWNLFETIQLKPEKAIHYLAGAEWRPSPAYTAKPEGYYKDLEHLVVATDSTYNFVPDNSGEGFAYGIAAFLQKRPSSDGRLWGWISYSLSTTKEKNRIDPLHPRDFDQRHTLNMIGSLRLSRGWSTNTRYNFGSGLPWTPVQTDSTGDPRFDEAGDVIWGRTNSKRNPAYRRWDLRLEWDRGTAKGVRILAYFEIINMLGRKNVHDYFWSDDYRTRGVSYMLPRMLFFGVRLVL